MSPEVYTVSGKSAEIDAFAASRHCAPSPDGLFIATLYASNLVIRSRETLEVVRTIRLDPRYSARVTILQWASAITPPDIKDARTGSQDLRTNDEPLARCRRILIADPDRVQIYDLTNPCWSVIIDSITAGLGPSSAIQFSRDANSILIFSALQVHLKIHSLDSGSSVKIPSPKFSVPCHSTSSATSRTSPNGQGHDFRPRTGHLLLLTRPAARDVLSIHEPHSWTVIQCWEPGTVDAQGLRWSPHGRWIAVWDSVAGGGKVYIFTAEGGLYRTWSGWVEDEGKNEVGMGARSVEWSSDGEALAVGDWEGRVTLLNSSTVGRNHTTSVWGSSG